MMRCLLLFVAFAAGSNLRAEEKQLPRIVGHRGSLQTHPENTLAGFRAGWEAGNAVELDVRRTKDGHLVVLHDDAVDRTTDGMGKVAELTLAEVKKLDAGKKAKQALPGERVPELREVFELLKKQKDGGIGIAVDLKIDDGKVEADVVKLAREIGVLDRLLFIGTTIINPDVRARLRAADPGAHAACLAESREFLTAALADKNSDWVYLRFVPSEEQMKAIRQAKKKVFLSGPLFQKYEADNWKKAAAAGADAVLTDFPIEMRDLLKRDGK